MGRGTVRGVFLGYAPAGSDEPIKLAFDIRVRSASFATSTAAKIANRELPGAVLVLVNSGVSAADVLGALKLVRRDIKDRGLFAGVDLLGDAWYRDAKSPGISEEQRALADTAAPVKKKAAAGQRSLKRMGRQSYRQKRKRFVGPRGRRV